MTVGEEPGAATPSADSPAAAPAAAFISYASADRPVADALTAYLEQRGIRCWIAPRDVPPGALYAEAIVRAISEAQALLLLLSHHSIESSHVGKEVERASSKKKRIIAVRLDAAPLTPGFEYFLSESQWVDVAGEGREAAFAKLAGALKDPPASRTPASLPRALPPARARWRGWPVAAGVVALAALALGGAWLLRTSRPAAPAAASAANDKSIAVLPFADMSEAHDQEYFADGMSEQILDLLAKIPALKVIARTSSFQFKGKAEDVRVVGEKLGVATVLEGSVRKAGDRLRITAQLIRASDGTHLWSESYDRQVRDVFRTQDEIADAVVTALRVSLLGAAATARPPPTANTEAYALYLQGLAYAQRYTAAESAKARELFHRALALDPNFAPATSPRRPTARSSSTRSWPTRTWRSPTSVSSTTTSPTASARSRRRWNSSPTTPARSASRSILRSAAAASMMPRASRAGSSSAIRSRSTPTAGSPRRCGSMATPPRPKRSIAACSRSAPRPTACTRASP
jgi:TolB-like protein